MTNHYDSLLIKIIKVGMAHANTSQKELAFKVGVSEAEITRWFSGERAIPLLKLDTILDTLDLMVVSKAKLQHLFNNIIDKEFLV